MFRSVNVQQSPVEAVIYCGTFWGYQDLGLVVFHEMDGYGGQKREGEI
jgi:hypothetical protein